MINHQRRAYERKNYQTPVRSEMVDGGEFFDSKIVNFSEGGLCLETERPLDVNAFVNIQVENRRPDREGPEGFSVFLGEVRWCRKILSTKQSFFNTGVQFMTKNREIPNAHLKTANCSCGLCGDLSLTRHVRDAVDHVHLCPHCYKNMNTLPHGGIKNSIERFLTGNVL